MPTARTQLVKAGLTVPVSKTKLAKYGADVAALVRDVHVPESLTLVILNTVARARAVYEKLLPARSKSNNAGTRPDLLLIHSHFRPPDKERALRGLLGNIPPAGRIVVSTQVVEAGVDVSARTLFTELAPWASLVQRLGRCNRYGEVGQGSVWWIDVPAEASPPYEPESLHYARKTLSEIRSSTGEGEQVVSPEVLAAIPVPEVAHTHVLRRPDLVGLFDTTPDLTGLDVDVSRYIRDTDDHDVHVFWRDWGDGRPPASVEAPAAEELCSVPIGELREFASKHDAPLWRWDHLDGQWVRCRPQDLRPGVIVLIHAASGGYSTELGWGQGQLDPVPAVATSAKPDSRAGDDGKPGRPRGEDAEEALGDDLALGCGWATIAEHSDLTVEIAERLLAELQTLGMSADLKLAVREAARWHDLGKAHPVFQESYAKRLWGKGGGGRIKHKRRYFRHELASALAYLQLAETTCHSSGSGETVPLTDLAAYLVAAHHGRVRLAIRSMPEEHRPPGSLDRRYALGIWEGDSLPRVDLGGGIETTPMALDLSLIELGFSEDNTCSWLCRCLMLRDSPELGPFRLGFLEALLRAADVRASLAHAKRGDS